MKKMMICALFLFAMQAVFAGGPDGPMFEWSTVRTVKGGMKQCTMSSKDEIMGTSTATATYDEKGRIVSFDGTYGEKYQFVYDRNGRLSELQKGSGNESGGFEPYQKDVYTYDGEGKLMKVESTGNDGTPMGSRSAFGHDRQGYKLETVNYEGQVYGYELYSKDGLLLEKIVYDSNPATGQIDKAKTASKTAYTYDKNGNRVTRVTNNLVSYGPGEPKKMTLTSVYKVDGNGNKTSETNKLKLEPAGANYYEPYFASITYTYGKTAKTQASVDTNTATTTTTTTTVKDDKSLVNKKVQVEYNGAYYTATILKVENGKYYIHYDDYDESWDEWVTGERVKF
jgi:YD repeat-containing protein